ncbi:PhoU domain-containing protein [Thermococcus sp. 21S7]|uniref:PhoU domain-containing protein n=1 Tax=Thermococcus sp. 21S7 TaxID=1638221 RepID=UPI001439ACEA|nr:PhoU domain-containing protein [Thermococcus sp. 21S7]NJE60890.1 phosphate transporter PhoU [Thermococcus sp. 21S7]
MKWKAMEKARNLLEELGGMVLNGMETLEREAKENEPGEVEDLFWEAVHLRMKLNDILIEILLRYQPLARELRFVRSALDSSYDLYRIARHLSRMEALLFIGSPECARDVAVDGLSLLRSWLAIGIESLVREKPYPVEELPFLELSFEEFWKGNVKTENPMVMATLMHCEGIYNHTKNVLRSALYYLEGSKGLERAPILFVS